MCVMKRKFFEIALALSLFLPGAVFAADAADDGDDRPVMSDERMEAIIEKADAVLAREEEITAKAAKFNDPKYLHKVTNRREVWLERVRDFNQSTLLSLEQFGPVRQFDFTYGEHFAKLGIQVQDVVQPLFYGAELLFDIDTMAEYFDSLIEIVAESIIKKEDTVFYNLDLMLNTESESFFATMFKNLDESLQKTMASNDQMKRLALKFFKKRIVPSLMQYVEKVTKSPPFLMRSMPKTDEEKQALRDTIHHHYPETEEEKAAWSETAPVVSVLDYMPVRMVVAPLLSLTLQPAERKINELVSGYVDLRSSITPAKLASAGAGAYFSLLGSFFPRAAHGITGFLLEASKQAGFSKPFDETISFTMGTELLFNFGFFYHTLNLAIEKAVQDLVINDCIALHDAIRVFELRINNSRNQTPEKQAEVKLEFKNEIYAIVRRNLAPMQPIFLEKFRDHHRSFKTWVTVALLCPIVYKICRLGAPFLKMATQD